MKIYSWNVNGVRSVAGKGFADWAAGCGADIICLQETKAEESQVPDGIRSLPGFASSHWGSGVKKGYSGVATFCRQPPLEVARGFGLDGEFDREGRILATRHPEFTLLNIYFPNGQMSQERLDYKLRFYDAALEYCERLRHAGAELVVTGDFNTAHNEIDLARPKANEQTSGFLRVERDWMDKFEGCGYVDTFRRLHPDEVKYSWWSFRSGARERNVGWRIDYFYVSPGLLPAVAAAGIEPETPGSDHCPIFLELEFPQLV